VATRNDPDAIGTDASVLTASEPDDAKSNAGSTKQNCLIAASPSFEVVQACVMIFPIAPAVPAWEAFP
jgi:hypothetical protein